MSAALMAERDALLAERARLRREISETREVCLERAHLVESYEIVIQGEEAIAKETKRLHGLIRTVEATRDQFKTTCGELRKEVWAKQQRLARLEPAAQS